MGANTNLVNKELRKAGLFHVVARFERGDCQVDDSIIFFVDGVESRFSLQLGRGYVIIGELTHDASGQVDGMNWHGEFRRVADALPRLISLLVAEASR